MSSRGALGHADEPRWDARVTPGVQAEAHTEGHPLARDSRYDPVLHGPRRVVGAGFHAAVWDMVRLVPAGRVTTYGDVAAALGLRSVARQVGWALAAIPVDQPDVPWQRVLNARGELSRRADGRPHTEQARRLRAEGLALDERGRVIGFAALRWDFERHG